MRKSVTLVIAILAALLLTVGAHYDKMGGKGLLARLEHSGSTSTVSPKMMMPTDGELSTVGSSWIERQGDRTSQSTTEASITTTTASTTTHTERQSSTKPTAKPTKPQTSKTTSVATTSTKSISPQTTVPAVITTKPTVPEITLTTTVKSISYASYEDQVVALVNDERSKENLPPLTMNSSLRASARLRAREIVDVWGHTRPNGTRFFTAVTIAYSRVGENIGAGCPTPARVVQRWMESPGHRSNIMNPCFTLIGVGCHYDSTQPYGTYWGQIFATP